eukprot:INCI15392.1.p1 GENE.INCI15392.1~~INCI15392.1.p1  ORF type:complete len:199 (+),score=39.46 INCI15392.1:302-898(+)
MWRLRTFLPPQQQQQQQEEEEQEEDTQQPKSMARRRMGEDAARARVHQPRSEARLPSPVKSVRRPSSASMARLNAQTSASRARASPRNAGRWHRLEAARPQVAETHEPPQRHPINARAAASGPKLTLKHADSVRTGLSKLSIRTRPNTAAARVVTQHGVTEQNKYVRVQQQQQQQQQRRRRRRQGTTAAQRHAHLDQS